MEAKEVINKLKTILGMEIKLEQQMLADGVTTIESDLFEAGKEVFIVNGEERVPLPVGDYDLADGRLLVVTQEGIIGEVKEKEMEQPEIEKEVEVEVPLEASVETPAKKVVESQVKETYFEEIEKLKAEIVELKAQIEAKNEVKEEEEVIELKEEVKPISFNPENVNKVDLVDLTPNKSKSMRDKILESIYNK